MEQKDQGTFKDKVSVKHLLGTIPIVIVCILLILKYGQVISFKFARIFIIAKADLPPFSLSRLSLAHHHLHLITKILTGCNLYF